MATVPKEDQIETHVDRLRARGVDWLPEPALQIFDTYERQKHALLTDSTRSETFTKQQLDALYTTTDEAFRVAENAYVEATVKPKQQELAQILAEIKSPPTRAPEFETVEQKADRQSRATQELLTLNADLMVAQSSGDPDHLSDMLDELILGGHPERIRKIAPVIVGRLRALSDSGSQYLHALAQYDSWKHQHPSKLARKRELEAEIKATPQRARQQWVKAYETFRWGKYATGMRV
jgi:hypothetical protein